MCTVVWKRILGHLYADVSMLFSWEEFLNTMYLIYGEVLLVGRFLIFFESRQLHVVD